MIPLTLEALADVVGGELRDSDDAARTVDRVVIDSREAGPGALFVPLPGEHTDGHRFVADAVERGAAGFFVAADRAGTAEGVAGGVVVDDPGDALLGLGAWVRDEVDPLVIAITGSTGKTTTKDLTAAACASGRRTVASHGSFNNELGVPLTCCALEPDTEVLVAEVGARGLGHIASLARVLRPDVAVVTSVGAAHLELLGDLDTVARAKGELVESLDVDGVAVLNAEDPRVAAMAERAPGHVLTFAAGDTAPEAAWRAEDVDLDERARPRFTVGHPGGSVRVTLPMPGVHNVSNALAALAAADVAGVSVEAAALALREARVSPWRMELLEASSGAVVLNDAYNANPVSMRAALDTLAALPAQRRWAVLGLMAELGAGEREAHEEIGARCAELGIDGLVVVGADAAAIAAGAQRAGFDGVGGVTLASDAGAARAQLEPVLGPGDAVLVKASRSVGLEALASALADPELQAPGGGEGARDPGGDQ